VNFLALHQVRLLGIAQLRRSHLNLALLRGVTCLSALQLEGQLLQLSLFVIMIAAGLRELVNELHLVLLLDTVELAELIELSGQ